MGDSEAHVMNDHVASMVPRGYAIVFRTDRTENGGGILLGANQHLLCTPVNLTAYNVPKVAEMDGFTLDGTYYICCYMPNSMHIHVLIDMLQKLIIDHPGKKFVIVGDFNTHNKEWLCSTSPTDYAGTVAQEFCESFSVDQYVDFSTRGGNTLDLVMSHFPGLPQLFQTYAQAIMSPSNSSVKLMMNSPLNLLLLKFMIGYQFLGITFVVLSSGPCRCSMTVTTRAQMKPRVQW